MSNETDEPTGSGLPPVRADHLTRFRAGPDPRRNTGGRPRGVSITRRLRELLAAPVSELSLRPDSTGLDAVALRLLRAAVEGDVRAINSLMDRVEGKPTQRVKATVRNVGIADAVAEAEALAEARDAEREPD